VSGFDVHIEGVPAAQVKSIRCVTFGSYGRVLGVKGIQKMIDRFLKCFMTPLGTDISDPSYGTILATSFLGNINSGDLYSIALQSVSAAQQKIQEYDSYGNAEDDERLSSAQIDNIAVEQSSGAVQITLRLTNAAGTVVKTQMSSYLGT
jgi:hypothetical protein